MGVAEATRGLLEEKKAAWDAAEAERDAANAELYAVQLEHSQAQAEVSRLQREASDPALAGPAKDEELKAAMQRVAELRGPEAQARFEAARERALRAPQKVRYAQDGYGLVVGEAGNARALVSALRDELESLERQRARLLQEAEHILKNDIPFARLRLQDAMETFARYTGERPSSDV